MNISHDFDSGSIAVINTKNIQLELTTDNNNNTMQWFHFRCHTNADLNHTIRILNAGKSSFSNAWKNYQAMASYDKINWFRVPTQFINNQLVINYTPIKNDISYTYFTPYDYERQQSFIKRALQFEQCRHTPLAYTLDNNVIY